MSCRPLRSSCFAYRVPSIKVCVKSVRQNKMTLITELCISSSSSIFLNRFSILTLKLIDSSTKESFLL